MIAGATMLILAVMSVVIVIAILRLKQNPTSNGLQQEVLKDSESVTPEQLEFEDYEMLSEMKNNGAYIPNSQQLLIETEDNVAYYSPRGNEHYYSNDQYDYEDIL